MGEPIPYELGRLWPQGTLQTAVANAVAQIEMLEQLQKADPTKFTADHAQVLKTATEQLPKLEQELRESGGSSPIFALVHSIVLHAGDLGEQRCASYFIVGLPFGPFATMGKTVTDEVPHGFVRCTKGWPTDELELFLSERDAQEPEPAEPEQAEEEEAEEEEDTASGGEPS